MKQELKGFTLIELIVVIAIIAVLAAVVAPNAFKSIEKAKISGTLTDLNSIKTATLAYYGDIQTWPANTTSGSGFVTAPSPAVAGWDGPYLDKWPATSKWGGNYSYRFDDAQGWSAGSANDDARYIEVSGVPENAKTKIDLQIDGNISGNNGTVRYGGTGTPLRYLISTDVSVN
ncbi:MAG: type II secretion system protein [Deltaproteobacteria bacterium]